MWGQRIWVVTWLAVGVYFDSSPCDLSLPEDWPGILPQWSQGRVSRGQEQSQQEPLESGFCNLHNFPDIDFIVSCYPASHRTLRSPGMGKGTDCRMDEPPSHYQEMCTLLKKTSRPTIGNFPQAYQKPSLCGASPWRYHLEEMTT